MDPRGAVIPGLLSQEVNTLRRLSSSGEERGNSERQGWNCKIRRGQSCHEYRGRPAGSPDAPADHIESCTNYNPPVQRKLANLANVPSALSLPSEEQYSKCTYPLCFDFSQCPLPQPFHVFVNNHHFRNLFNLKYPVDSFVT